MKNSRFLLLILLIHLVILNSCQKNFNDFSKNKNALDQAPPSLVLRTILKDMYSVNSNDRNYSPFSQVERNNQFTCCNYNYYGDNTYWNGSATLDYGSTENSNSGTLNNVLAMESESKRITGSTQTPYFALGKFFRAWFFVDMTMKVGDLPMNDALKSLSNPKPKYDNQKAIFLQCFQWLDSANNQLSEIINKGVFANNNPLTEFSGDFYHTERLSNPTSAKEALMAWQKIVNTFRLRVLINLSKKEADPDLKVIEQFDKILQDPMKYPIMTSEEDNLQFVYNAAFDNYPNSPLNFGNDALRYNMGATYLNALSSLQDIRAMIVAEPSRGLGYADTSYESFVGGVSGISQDSMTSLIQSEKISLIGRHRYYETLTGENTFILSYQEMCFNIAEAMNRNWTAPNAGGDAETWYKNGIQASMKFYGIIDGLNTVTFIKEGGSLGEDVSYKKYFNFASYYAQLPVKYSSDQTIALSQILNQKYYAFFRNSGLEAYYQWRRTGIPVFDSQTGVGNGGKIPTRFQYPATEAFVNTDNYSKALQDQYGGKDDIFETIWMLK